MKILIEVRRTISEELESQDEARVAKEVEQKMDVNDSWPFLHFSCPCPHLPDIYV